MAQVRNWDRTKDKGYNFLEKLGKRMKSANYINHVALVLDKSWSMMHLSDQVVQVADELIAHLAKKSTEMDQETRVTVYLFDDHVKCVIFDKDVLRLPSIKDYYQAGGNTALLNATAVSQNDLAKTAQMYGDHAFLTYVLTDGEENRSFQSTPFMTPDKLQVMLNDQPENWTVACLVPDAKGVRYAERYGFPKDNITIWEVSAAGLKDAATKITRSTDSYMTSRAKGVRGTKTLFSTGIDTVNKNVVNSKTLQSLDRGTYQLLKVDAAAPIREWVLAQNLPFQIGKAYYELTKRESIQPQKALAIQNIHSGRVYTGPQVRDLLGLPTDVEVRVTPDANPEYRIYVQSTSVNRKLVLGTRLLLLN